MNGNSSDPALDDTQGPCASIDSADVPNGDVAVVDEAITSRDIDALVQLKLLRKAL